MGGGLDVLGCDEALPVRCSDASVGLADSDASSTRRRVLPILVHLVVKEDGIGNPELLTGELEHRVKVHGEDGEVEEVGGEHDKQVDEVRPREEAKVRVGAQAPEHAQAGVLRGIVRANHVERDGVELLGEDVDPKGEVA